MGYFSNGSEGDMYHSKYCSKCVHMTEENMCPIIGLHHMFSYELCNKKEDPGKVMLDTLIPPSKDGCWNDKCRMFHEA